MVSSDDSSETDRSETDSETPPTRFDRDRSDRATTALVEAVATVTGRKPTDLPPLYESVDTDALEALLSSTATRSGRPVSVSFEYAGVEVVVHADQDIEIRPDPTGRSVRPGADRREDGNLPEDGHPPADRRDEDARE